MTGAVQAATKQIIQITKKGAKLGAEINNVELRQTLDQSTIDDIEAALAEHELLIFHDQDITGDQLMAFGCSFGDLSVHPFTTNDDNHQELIKFENKADTPPALTDIWHSDETFRLEPPRATILCAKEVPEVGGDTVFASMSAAYEGLSDRMQHFISGLEGIHDFKPFKTLFPDTPEGTERLQHYERLYRPAAHPVVTVHPVSGKKILYVSPQFTIRIKGMGERESRSLLDDLFYQTLTPEYQFRHHWRPHTLVFWDNRSTQHYAVHDYYPQRRIMDRVTIAGTRPVGLVKEDKSDLKRSKFVVIGEGADLNGGLAPNNTFR